MISLRHPHVRLQILDALDDLAAPDHQQRVWIDRQVPDDLQDDLSTNIHVLFDDTQVLSDARKQVGFSIYDEEIPVLNELGRTFGSLIDELGDVRDTVYFKHTGWGEVVAAARRAAEVMRQSDERAGDRPPLDPHRR